MKVVHFAIVLVLVGLSLTLAWESQAQSVKLVNGQLSDANDVPLSNQTILIEGRKKLQWVNAWGLWGNNTVKFRAITDQKGFVQIVDLPAGTYDMKLVVPGGAPTLLKKLDLPSDYQTVYFKGKVELNQ